jgi:hypothetical protein
VLSTLLKRWCVAESQAKLMGFWTSSMGTVRSNAEAITRVSPKAIDRWMDLVRKNTGVTDMRCLQAKG